MSAWIALLLQILPWVTRLAVLIGAANGLNTGNAVVSYGASPDVASLWGVVIPWLLAAASHGGTIKLRDMVSGSIGSPLAGALVEITAILGLREIGASDPAFQATAKTLAHQWVDTTFGKE